MWQQQLGLKLKPGGQTDSVGTAGGKIGGGEEDDGGGKKDDERTN